MQSLSRGGTDNNLGPRPNTRACDKYDLCTTLAFKNAQEEVAVSQSGQQFGRMGRGHSCRPHP